MINGETPFSTTKCSRRLGSDPKETAMTIVPSSGPHPRTLREQGRGRATTRRLLTTAVTALLMMSTLIGAATAFAATPPPPTTVSSTLPGSAATVQLADGTQLTVGGCAPYHCPSVLTSAAIYNPKTKTTTPTGSTVTGHASATATLLASGQVLLAGGCTGRLCGKDNPTSELWNPATGRWSTTGSMLTSPVSGLTPRNASAVLLANGRVLVAGGLNYEAVAQRYDPATATWTATTPMTAPRESFTLITLTSGKVLAAGGCDDYYCQSILRSAEIYDPISGTWTATGNMRQARYDHSATLLSSGQVRVTGGLNTSGVTATPDEIYTQSTGTWVTT